MRYAVQWLRSLVFVGQMYLMLPVIGLLYMPGAILSRKGAVRGCKAYCNWVRWSARWMVGLRTEVRGTPPEGQVLIASKHQSFLDILLIYSELPAGRFIMKREILWTPVIGLYGMRIGCIPVNRGNGPGCGARRTKARAVDHLRPRHPRGSRCEGALQDWRWRAL
jgi:1-acyl-sn-glycerol-3-phosphate acyltransferase